MDGTGILYEPLLNLIPSSIECDVIPLSTLHSDTPALQAIELAKLIGSGDVIIFAESFAGLLAYELCKLNGLSIKHVFFAAGFLERPSKISQYSRLLPLWPVRSKLIPAAVLSYIFFGSYSKSELIVMFYQSLAEVTNKTLRARLALIAKAERPKTKIHQSVTYIRASNDWLVSAKSKDVFEQLCTNLTVIDVEGGHFIAQCNPEHCYREIKRFIT